jgi:hypothetical protein
MLKRLSPLNIHYRQGEKLLENVSSLTSDHFWRGGGCVYGQGSYCKRSISGNFKKITILHHISCFLIYKNCKKNDTKLSFLLKLDNANLNTNKVLKKTGIHNELQTNMDSNMIITLHTVHAGFFKFNVLETSSV